MKDILSKLHVLSIMTSWSGEGTRL